ncbi:MAG: DUF512 domain-containing protein [candidate division WOR-3 bacterium]|nr:MAG: DUF512 domain-containing protein [candidate division WOR-3 bacterium]
MVKVVSSKDSKIPQGCKLIRINSQLIDDLIEFEYYNDQTNTRNIAIEYDGTRKILTYKPGQKIDITLEPPQYRRCANNCDFCFINGLPPGLRDELYFRDDDYRLSFLFGNFLSLTNIDRGDISRIGRLRLTPLYVSVHTTDPSLRIALFKNENGAHIFEQLKALADENIRIHCQIVVIPGVTDGPGLIATIEKLGTLYPAVQSIGVVPVGETKYVDGIRSVTKALSHKIIESVNALHLRYRKDRAHGLVYLADEFFVKAGHPIPDRSYYDDFPQYENGIGMVRCLLDEIAQVKKIKKTRRNYLILTGRSAYPFLKILQSRLAPYVHVDLMAVANRFFGSSVTVSGLICASDINRSIKRHGNGYDRIILPPNCTNDASRFLDDKKISEERAIIAPATIKELLKCLQ